MSINPIETHYAGCRFRSRLEARWAVFFDHLGLGWEYEPQGFVINGTPYLPDFLLIDSGTWVEVKGDEAQLDQDLLWAAAENLPLRYGRNYSQPSLLVLGPIPEPPTNGDWAWMGFSRSAGEEDEDLNLSGWWRFVRHGTRGRIEHARETSCGTPADVGMGSWIVPTLDMGSQPDVAAYAAARSARFEHGERG